MQFSRTPKTLFASTNYNVTYVKFNVTLKKKKGYSTCFFINGEQQQTFETSLIYLFHVITTCIAYFDEFGSLIVIFLRFEMISINDNFVNPY